MIALAIAVLLGMILTGIAVTRLGAAIRTRRDLLPPCPAWCDGPGMLATAADCTCDGDCLKSRCPFGTGFDRELTAILDAGTEHDHE